jgi:hypothetical protein
MDEIVNKVAASGIITLDMEELYPQGERVVFDLKPLLWQEVALKEDDLRAFAKTHDWSRYKGKLVSVHCSVDAIIPTWAFMLVATHLQPHAAFITQGDADQLERAVFTLFVQNIDLEPYRGARVVVKGCSKLPVPLNAYGEEPHVRGTVQHGPVVQGPEGLVVLSVLCASSHSSCWR